MTELLDDIHIIHINGSEVTAARADKLYRDLQDAGYEVLYDDRGAARAGEKFADADLIGIPTRIVVSDKNVVGPDGKVLFAAVIIDDLVHALGNAPVQVYGSRGGRIVQGSREGAWLNCGR